MSTNQNESNSLSKPTTLSTVGQTWSNAGPINIDLDNLLSPKSKSTGPSLSMNQLKLQSPVKTQQPSAFPIQPTNASQTASSAAATAAHINTNLANNNINSTINNNNFGATNQFGGNNHQTLSGFGNLLSNTMSPTTNNLSNQFNAFQ